MLVLGWTQIFQTLISVLPEMDFTKIAKYSLFYWRFWQFWAIFGKTHEVSLLRHPDAKSYLQNWTSNWTSYKSRLKFNYIIRGLNPSLEQHPIQPSTKAKTEAKKAKNKSDE